MQLAIANAATKNARFDDALDRTFKFRQILQSRLKQVPVDGCFNTLGFVISDYPSNFFKVNRKTDGSLMQVFVGYDVSASYSPADDVNVISMLACWTRRAFEETEGYAAKRMELLDIVNRWEVETVQMVAHNGGAHK